MTSSHSHRVRRATRHGKKNAARRTNTRSGTERTSARSGFTCFTCGAKSRLSDVGWEGYVVPNVTDEVRMLCPSHAAAATFASVFPEVFPEGLPALECMRCGRTRGSDEMGWSAGVDDTGQVVGYVCGDDLTVDERAEVLLQNEAVERRVVESLASDGERARHVRLAEILASELFAEKVSRLVHPAFPQTPQDVTRRDIVDWAAECVDRVDPPEDRRSDLLALLFEQFSIWFEEFRSGRV